MKGDVETKAVIMLLYPPESLRGATLEQIRYVMSQPHNITAAIEEMAQTIYKSFTTEPEQPAVIRNVIEHLERHEHDSIEARRAREARGGQ